MIAKNPFKIAAALHFFYEEPMEEIVSLLERSPVSFDIFASVSKDLHARAWFLLKKAFPDRSVVLKIVENRGFDIAPFVCEFKEAYAAYDLILKLHTKKSSHVMWLGEWRHYLLKNLVGSAEVVQTIIHMFRENEALGLVYPQVIPPLQAALAQDSWQENWGVCRGLSSRLGLTIHREQRLDFPVGSMFWMRPAALEPLFKLGFQFNDFPKGRRMRRNGTLAHAIERLLVMIAQEKGFSARQVLFFPCARELSKPTYYERARSKVRGLGRSLVDFFEWPDRK